MYAVIETGGKQYKVMKGDVLYIEKLAAEEENDVTFDKIVAINDDVSFRTGTPYLEGVAVEARVIKKGKAKKITVFTYKAKKNEKRKMGHRQPYTKIEITSITV